MASEQDERLATELSLLEAMYAEQISYRETGRELTYTTSQGAALKLRLPDTYLSTSLPEVLSASSGKSDLRDIVKSRIQKYGAGEEILDSVISIFDSLAEAESSSSQAEVQGHIIDQDSSLTDKSATIVIWLHHLLNTNKRKLALSPSALSGITKPGYPGVLVYSGPAREMHEHVDELKAQNWAAFQVRYESGELWEFAHGKGIVEVEAMKEVVAGVGEERKEEFMEAMRMK